MIPTESKKLTGREVTETFAGVSTSTPTAHAVNGSHPLESRIRGWSEAQESLRMESYRRAYGAAEPIKRAMELKIVDRGIPGMNSIHGDILRNRESHIDWEDVYREDMNLDVNRELSETVHLRDL